MYRSVSIFWSSSRQVVKNHRQARKKLSLPARSPRSKTKGLRLLIIFQVSFQLLLKIKLLIQITKTEKKAVYSYILFSFLIAILSPASASYHFLLLLPAIALFLKICDDTETKIVTLVFVLLCGYSQIAVDRLPDYLHLLPVVFYRLMLMNIFCVWMMRKMHYWGSN